VAVGFTRPGLAESSENSLLVRLKGERGLDTGLEVGLAIAIDLSFKFPLKGANTPSN